MVLELVIGSKIAIETGIDMKKTRLRRTALAGHVERALQRRPQHAMAAGT